MENFKPWIYVIWRKDGTIAVFAMTMTPNLCYEPGCAEEGVPEGHVIIEDVLPIKLHINFTSRGVCSMVQKPVFHLLDQIVPTGNQSQVTIFTMLDDKVVGINSSPIPEKDKSADKNPANYDNVIPFPVGTREGTVYLIKEKKEPALKLEATAVQPLSEIDRVAIKVKISDVDIYAIRLNNDDRTTISAFGDSEIRLKLKPGVHILDYIVRGTVSSEYKVEITGNKKRLVNHKELTFSDITLSDGEGGGSCRLNIK